MILREIQTYRLRSPTNRSYGIF